MQYLIYSIIASPILLVVLLFVFARHESSDKTDSVVVDSVWVRVDESNAPLVRVVSISPDGMVLAETLDEVSFTMTVVDFLNTYKLYQS